MFIVTEYAALTESGIWQSVIFDKIIFDKNS